MANHAVSVKTIAQTPELLHRAVLIVISAIDAAALAVIATIFAVAHLWPLFAVTIAMTVGFTVATDWQLRRYRRAARMVKP